MYETRNEIAQTGPPVVRPGSAARSCVGDRMNLNRVALIIGAGWRVRGRRADRAANERDVASAVELAVCLRVKPGDRGEQFAADITGLRRQMSVAKPTAR